METNRPSLADHLDVTTKEYTCYNKFVEVSLDNGNYTKIELEALQAFHDQEVKAMREEIEAQKQTLENDVIVIEKLKREITDHIERYKEQASILEERNCRCADLEEQLSRLTSQSVQKEIDQDFLKVLNETGLKHMNSEPIKERFIQSVQVTDEEIKEAVEDFYKQTSIPEGANNFELGIRWALSKLSAASGSQWVSEDKKQEVINVLNKYKTDYPETYLVSEAILETQFEDISKEIIELFIQPPTKK